ncbi:unnamed protein product [Ectocarpus sp. CCAP 1310/34]|nr:unnamed protein product [Ectocarpus sp. CCAP 1310/34]
MEGKPGVRAKPLKRKPNHHKKPSLSQRITTAALIRKAKAKTRTRGTTFPRTVVSQRPLLLPLVHRPQQLCAFPRMENMASPKC